jgi:hypothetical protein
LPAAVSVSIGCSVAFNEAPAVIGYSFLMSAIPVRCGLGSLFLETIFEIVAQAQVAEPTGSNSNSAVSGSCG